MIDALMINMYIADEDIIEPEIQIEDLQITPYTYNITNNYLYNMCVQYVNNMFYHDTNQITNIQYYRIINFLNEFN